MGFNSEEELEAWYAIEKEKLDAKFTAELDKDHEHVSEGRARFELAFKKLIAKYQDECEKLLLKKSKK